MKALVEVQVPTLKTSSKELDFVCQDDSLHNIRRDRLCCYTLYLTFLVLDEQSTLLFAPILI